ncbi:MAG: hypothetical protein V4625_12785 [Pseudomonadota bacterium]
MSELMTKKGKPQWSAMVVVTTLITLIPVVGPGLMLVKGLQYVWKSKRRMKLLTLYAVMMSLWALSLMIALSPEPLVAVLDKFQLAGYLFPNSFDLIDQAWRSMPWMLYVLTCFFMAVQHVRLALELEMNLGVISDIFFGN